MTAHTTSAQNLLWITFNIRIRKPQEVPGAPGSWGAGMRWCKKREKHWGVWEFQDWSSAASWPGLLGTWNESAEN